MSRLYERCARALRLAAVWLDQRAERHEHRTFDADDTDLPVMMPCTACDGHGMVRARRGPLTIACDRCDGREWVMPRGRA